MKHCSFASPFLLLVLASCIVCHSAAFHRASLPRLRTFARQINDDRCYVHGSYAFLEHDDNAATLSKRNPNASNDSSPLRWLFRKRKRIFALLFPSLVIILCTGSVHAASSIQPERLGPRNLLAATIVLLSLGALPL